MKKSNLLKFRNFLAVALSVTTSLYTNAQQLPNIQYTSFFAPANTKMDGKDEEWTKAPHTYNKAINVSYTLANDESNLYLIIRAKDEVTIGKIFLGGVMLTIKNTASTANNSISVTYPAYEKNERTLYLNLENKAKIKAFAEAQNSTLRSKLKTVKVTGTNLIKDSLLSVYNEQEIKANALFNTDMQYIYELAVPLKYLGIPSKTAKLSYDIKLRGGSALGTPKVFSRGGVPGGATIIMTDGSSNDIGKMQDSIELAFPTDLEGEYTLAIK